MKIKLFLCILMALCASARGADDIKIMISIPQMDTARDRLTPDHKPVWTRVPGHSLAKCFVVVENCSTRPLLFLGSSGDDGQLGKLSFQVTCSDGKTTVIEPVFPPVFAIGAEIPQKLDAGEAMVLEFNPGPYDFPFPKHGDTEKATLRAVFEQEFFGDAAGKAEHWGGEVWIGKAISDPCEVTFMK